MFNWFEIINIKSILILQIIVLCLLPRLIDFFCIKKKDFSMILLKQKPSKTIPQYELKNLRQIDSR